MKPLQRVETDAQREAFCALPGVGALDPPLLARHAPDESWLAGGDAPLTRCSLWWTRVPPPEGERRLGLIGHFASADEGATAALLEHACARLRAQGCTHAVGPMDGNTWRSYRLISERGEAPPFFLEPHHPPGWAEQWSSAGFAPLMHYTSALNAELKQDPRLEELSERAAADGIALRRLNPGDFDGELRRIYAVSAAGFAKNYLYLPIEEDEFVQMYAPVRPFVRPELVLLAERKEQPVGFVFAVPDAFQARRGEPVDTAVIKSAAVLTECQGIGLGSLLMARVHREIAALGYRRAIHALMREDNRMRRISDRSAETIRRYTLYIRRLA